jgi:glycosyltransferase involved in cell wall biosynthesis
MGWLLNRWHIQRELNHLVHAEGMDIVEGHDWCGLSAGLRPDCPVVIRCNGTATYFAHLLQEKVRPSVRWAECLALRDADSVVAVSRFTAGITRRLFRLVNPVGVLHNSIDISQFDPADEDEIEEDTILYLGTLVRKKGVLDLSRIFSRVIEERPQARLWLVGRDTPDKHTGSVSTWDLCRELLSPAARKRVEYFGLQPYDKVHDYVRKAAVCVFPSYAEAFPLAWLEAMACAKPVIAYDVGWAPEVIESGSSGMLSPVGNLECFAQMINKTLSDREQRRRLGLAARQRVESLFASDVAAQRSVRWYQKVLETR